MDSLIKWDKPTYPEFGNIYDGDYYKNIPYKSYIQEMNIENMEGKIFDVRDYGAMPENDYESIEKSSEGHPRLYTSEIQRALNECEKSGGGIVYLSGGIYRSGTLYIGDNTTLFVNHDSVLMASRNMEHFDGAFIIARHAKNITITGGGIIHGQGEWFVYEPSKRPLLEPLPTTIMPRRDAEDINGVVGTMRYHYRQRIRYADDKYNEGLPDILRPDYMVWCQGSSGVIIENIILRDAMAWTLNLDTCDHVCVRSLVIDNNRHVANTDGIDITGSRHVTIEHCFIATADDGIVIKNPPTTGRDMFDICIHDCRIQSVMNAFKIGTETKYDIMDVEVYDCIFELPDIYPGMVSGISIESADGSIVKNVRIHDIRMNQVTCPIFMALNMRNRYGTIDLNSEERTYGGEISDVKINNIKAKDVEVPCILSGFVYEGIKKPLKFIEIADIEFRYRDNEEILDIPQSIEEYLYEYPENNNFGDVDAFGIWARHVEQLSLSDIHIQPRTSNNRECIKLYDVMNK